MDHHHFGERGSSVQKIRRGIDPVLFGVTDKDFQVLARNFAQIRQKLQETNNLLEEYKKYYEDSGNTQ